MNMRISFFGVVLVAGASALAAAQTVSPASGTGSQSLFKSTTLMPTGNVVARINGTKLTDRDLLREMMTIFPYARQHGGKFPEAMEADIRRGALDMLEFEELVYQEALRRKMKISSARMETATKAFREQFRSAEEFQAYLKTECGDSIVNLREKIRRSMLIEDLLQREVNQKANVSEAEVQEFYKKNPARFYSPQAVSIQTISLVIPDQPTTQQDKDVRKRAEDALLQAKKTTSYEEFGMLAEKISEDDWRVMMGDHQFVISDRMPPEVAKVAFSLQPGQVSDLIRAENSWCIVRLNTHQEAHWASYEQVKTSLHKELQGNKVEALRRSLHQQLRKKAKVEEL